jgi:hypothetical protein
VEHDVGGFEVIVDDFIFLIVKVLDGIDELFDDDFGFAFIKAKLFIEVRPEIRA